MAEKRICPHCGKELPIRYGQGRIVRELQPGDIVICVACFYALKVVEVNGALELGLLTKEEWKNFNARLREFGERNFIEMLKGSKS